MKQYLSKAAGLSESEKGKLQVELMMLKEKVASVGYTLYQQVAAFRLERHLVLLEYLLYFMSLHSSFFHHGYHTMKDNEAGTNVLREAVQKLRGDAKQHKANVRALYVEERKKAETSVAEEDMLTTLASEGAGVKKEGWLIKLSNSPAPGMMQRWKRKWFVLENGRLHYRNKDSRNTDTKGNIDMMLTTVKLGSAGGGGGKSGHSRSSDRAFTFEVICANPRCDWQVQAESEQDRREWVHALQTVTANLLGISVPGAPSHGRRDPFAGGGSSGGGGGGGGGGAGKGGGGHEMGTGMSLLEEVPAFKECAECGSHAEWASINLGITLCLECSGAHRSLGVHITKVN